jgi:hypothetical protein
MLYLVWYISTYVGITAYVIPSSAKIFSPHLTFLTTTFACVANLIKRNNSTMMPSRWNHSVLLIAALASQMCEVSAFVGVSPNNARISTELYGTTKEPPFIPMPKDISYGEESRRYRRTVYSHDDWVKHRAPDRFLRNIVSSVTSGIYKNIQNEVAFVTSIATFVVLWNAMVGGYTDFEGVKQAGLLEGTTAPTLTLPMGPFTLSSASLGLLLGT